MKIFLVAGKAGSGKGEVASIIKEYYESVGKKALITEFSKYAKMYAKEILNWDGVSEKPRKFLQDIGVTIRDNMDKPMFFVDRMLDDMKVYELYFDVVILADVRLPQEIEAFKNTYKDIHAIYVVNQFAPSKLSLEEQMHITETALEDYQGFDTTIANDDLNLLKGKVINFIESECK